MAVIPGTVGGAVRMNAGTTREGEIKDHFLSALVMDGLTGVIREYTKKDMQFEYRGSILSKSSSIIIQTTFVLPAAEETDPEGALNGVRSLLAARRAKQPKNQKNFGSTFKHPGAEYPAGWYLEKVGMKGMQKGGAMVAHEHANWIVNVDNATSGDVKHLIETGKQRVYEEFGVVLEREVVYLPEDIGGGYDK